MQNEEIGERKSASNYNQCSAGIFWRRHYEYQTRVYKHELHQPEVVHIVSDVQSFPTG